MKIAYGNNRYAKKWINKEVGFDELCERLKTPIRTTETVAEYQKMNKDKKDEVKDVGGYVLGWLKGGKRKKDTIESRSGITLDADTAEAGLVDKIREKNLKACIYTTHSHTPELPRLRIVLPSKREMTAEEYGCVGRLIAFELGMDQFDDTTYEPNRLMYWPSTPSDGVYESYVFDGDELDVDGYLGRLSDWRDCTLWPTSTRQSQIIQKTINKQADPREKAGIIGVFCRVYGIDEVIEKYLEDVYERTDTGTGKDRYTYKAGSTSGGMVVYGDGRWSYSFHSTDPACGRLLNAFDLVRIHRFGDEKEKDSVKNMMALAGKDENVRVLMTNEKVEAAKSEFDDDGDGEWEGKLIYKKKGDELEDSVWNAMLILRYDPDFAGFAYNELAHRVQVIGEVPWDRPAENPFWRDADTAQVKALLDTKYVEFSGRNHDVAFTKVADDRRFHPIRNYLNNLPPWDGVERVDTLLVEFLNAEDSPYVRAVTRKTLCAAVARVFVPGIKFDSILVMDGEQDKGKSTLFSKLAGEEWYNDGLMLTDMQDKTGAEKLQGYWILEIGELAGMKKSDIDSVKAFVSRQDDIYRPSYGRVVESHKRQCIIVATVNGGSGYLRDPTGNRRFWPVKTPGDGVRNPWDITNEEIDQVWAEAKMMWVNGEKLYLEGEIKEVAKEKQNEAMETDPRESLIVEYLERLLPEEWDLMRADERREFLDGGITSKEVGVVRRKRVCPVEIWCECFGKDQAVMTYRDSYGLTTVLRKLGWENAKDKPRIPIYGQQRMWCRR